MSRLKEKKIDSLDHSAEDTQRQNPKQGNSEGFFGQKEAGALLPREKSVIALCVKP
jgi:hypothetical protein